MLLDKKIVCMNASFWLPCIATHLAFHSSIRALLSAYATICLFWMQWKLRLLLPIHVKCPFEGVSYQTSRPEVGQLKYRLESAGANFSRALLSDFSWLSSQNQKYHPTWTRFQTLSNCSYAMGFIWSSCKPKSRLKENHYCHLLNQQHKLFGEGLCCQLHLYWTLWNCTSILTGFLCNATH